MNKLKVLVTASTFPAGPHDSTPRFVLDICRGIASAGQATCLVLAPHSRGAKLAERLEGVPVRRFRYACPERWELISGQGIYARLKHNPRLAVLVPGFFLAQFLALAKIWVRWRPDVVLVNWLLPQGLIARAAKILFPDMKMIVVCHGGDFALLNKNYLLRKLGKFILGGANRVVAVSALLAAELVDRLQLGPGKTTVIPCGIDVGRIRASRRLSPRSEDYSLLFVGRLEAEKGVRYLLQAMALVVEEHPEAVLHLVGDGTLKNDLMMLSRQLNLAGTVVFHGAAQHAEVIRRMLKAAILLVPSISEGMPVVILEGMAAGIPIISTDAGGIPDIIRPYETGILVPQRDEKALAAEIIKLMKNKALQQRLADNAFNSVRTEFTIARTGEKFQEIIAAVSGNE